jgi:hypothetical protein
MVSSNADSAPMIESRTCSAYDIPIEKKDDSVPMIESRTCSAYDIPIEKKDDNIKNSQADSASSVIDKETISSRGISNTDVTRDEINDEIQSFRNAPLCWRNEIRSMLTIVIFLTRLPVPMNIDLHPGFLMKGMVYLPVVGMLIGIVVATVFDVCHIFLGLPAVIAACACTMMGWCLTGCFHEDGLSDSADGTFAFVTPTQQNSKCYALCTKLRKLR